jgi:hypothetical protein
MSEDEAEYGVFRTLFGKLPELVYSLFFCAHHYLREKPYHVAYVGAEALESWRYGDSDEEEQRLRLFTCMYNAFRIGSSAPAPEEYLKELSESDPVLSETAKLLLSCRHLDKPARAVFRYDGYLVNHTKKVAIDLADYHRRAMLPCVDPLPILTETGNGALMLFYDGATIDTTHELIGQWCWDVLQICDNLPTDYEVIPCCFSPLDSGIVHDVHRKNGCDEQGYVLDDNGERYRVIRFTLRGRAVACFVKAEESVTDDGRRCVEYTFCGD